MFTIPAEESAARHIMALSDEIARGVESDAQAHAARVAARHTEIEKAFAAAPRSPANDLAKEDAFAEAVRATRDAYWADKDGSKKRAQDLHQASADVDRAIAYWSDPKQCLDRATLACPRRTTYAANLQGAGPAALASMAEHARVTRDPSLAAAVIAALQPRPAKDRGGVDLSALAAEVQPESAARTLEHLRTARTALNRGMRAFDTIERSSPLAKIQRGLEARR